MAVNLKMAVTVARERQRQLAKQTDGPTGTEAGERRLRLSQLKLPLDHDEADLAAAACRRLRLQPQQLRSCRVVKRSVDARRREAIQLVYSLDLELDLSEGELKRLRNRFREDPSLREAPNEQYRFVAMAAPGGVAAARPVVIGAGPSGCVPSSSAR